MARKIFKRFSVDQHKLLASGNLSALGERIHDPNLWHLNRHSVSRAFLAGLFAGFAFILFPGQMLVAAVLAIWLRGNLPIACGLVWVSNPLTSPPVLYLALKLGAIFFPVEFGQKTEILLHFEWSMENFRQQANSFIDLVHLAWQPLLLGTIFIGTFLGIGGYFTVQLFWRWHVVRAWNHRQILRLQKT